MTAPLDPLTLATGVVLGTQRRPPPLPAAQGDTPLQALERAVLPLLRRAPCLVSFSGGRDSSLVLAVATRVARREALPDPIPATNHFRAAPSADETVWQERVVAHLGLADWIRLSFDEELDAVGPYARRVLLEHGLLWPFNVHFHLPLLEAARDGTVLTGIGGDELFAAACGPVGGRRPRALARTLLDLAPYVLRRPVLARREPFTLPWLTEAGNRAATAAAASHGAGEPRAPASRLAWARGMRCLTLGPQSLDAVASMTGAQIANPLLDRRLWAAIARAGGRRGFDGRRHGMAEVAGGLLPPDLIARRDKAAFDEAFWTSTAREAGAAWSGGGIPEALVDERALCAEWGAPAPMAQSFTLLQSVWLRSAADGGRELLGDGRQRVPAAGPPELEHGQ